jgi:hypothetical protein
MEVSQVHVSKYHGVASRVPKRISPPNSLPLSARTRVAVSDAAAGESFFTRTPRDACARAAIAFGS